jgi:hypothetical protein
MANRIVEARQWEDEIVWAISSSGDTRMIGNTPEQICRIASEQADMQDHENYSEMLEAQPHLSKSTEANGAEVPDTKTSKQEQIATEQKDIGDYENYYEMLECQHHLSKSTEATGAEVPDTKTSKQEQIATEQKDIGDYENYYELLECQHHLSKSAAAAGVGASDTKTSKQQLMRATPQYLVDVINHVARTDQRNTLVEEDAARDAVEKYGVWRKRLQDDDQAYPDYCEFAAFFAFEIANGSLLYGRFCGERIRLALDLMSHIILEYGLLDRIWKVEYNLRSASRVLVSFGGMPEQLLETFSIQRRK